MVQVRYEVIQESKNKMLNELESLGKKYKSTFSSEDALEIRDGLCKLIESVMVNEEWD